MSPQLAPKPIPHGASDILTDGFLVDIADAGRGIVFVKGRTHSPYLLVALTNIGKNKDDCKKCKSNRKWDGYFE